MCKIEKIAREVETKHAAAVKKLREGLAYNCDVPAQRQINTMFFEIGVERFPGGGHDVWEYMSCLKNGWDYQAPGPRLCAQWGAY